MPSAAIHRFALTRYDSPTLVGIREDFDSDPDTFDSLILLRSSSEEKAPRSKPVLLDL